MAALHEEASLDVKLRKLDGPSATVRVRLIVTREWKFRQWIALQLIALAYRVLGMKADARVEVEP